MERNDTFLEKRLLPKANETEVKQTENEEVEEEVEEEEEALSLCDLPITEETIQSNKETQQESKSTQDEFDFCSFSKDSEMCSADQVFFQGQILPLGNSVSLETSFLPSKDNSTTTTTTNSKYLSRSESIDTLSSTGFASGSSSRSSSLRSHQSSTSSGRSSVTTPIYIPTSFNNFNSYPSPRPHMKFSRIKNQNIHNSSNKSRTWSLLRLGLVATPEIVLDDLKHRSINNSKNNKNSFQKSKSYGDSDDFTRFKSKNKKKPGIFEANGTFFGTCKCSSNAVVTINSNIGTIKRSVGTKDEITHEERKGTKKHEEGKQSISRNRTFEWLKQLSLDTTSNVRNDA